MFGEQDREVISIEREKFREIKKGDIFVMGQDRVRVLAKVNKVSWRYENGREFYWFSMKKLVRKDLETGEIKNYTEDDKIGGEGGFLLSYSCNQDEGTQRHLPHGSWGRKVEPKNYNGILEYYFYEKDLPTIDACEAE